jgi:cGMP-dependent protein kinase
MLKTLKNSKSIFFLMESVFGKDLISVLNIHNGKLTRKHSMFYFASMILVCEYLQTKNIIHRDIKPENIIIMENGYIKLIDFSCAKTIKDTNNKSFTTIGTPYYMSPEIIKGEIYSFETDIWAMAVVLYQCYCGRVPFGNDSDDPLVIYKSILVDDITFPGFVSKDTQFKNLMKQMLNKSKAKRLTTINSIKVNPYLEGFDWNSLLNLNFAVPYVPSDVNVMMNHEEEIKKLKVVLDEEKDDKIITFDNVDEHKKFKEWFEGF